MEPRLPSQLSDCEHSNLGARRLTPHSMRINVVGQGKSAGLVFRAADGRSHRYPQLAMASDIKIWWS